MYSIKRILVALDLSELDEMLIAYAANMAEILATEKVYFFHVAKSLELPERVSEKYPDLLAPLDESLRNDLTKKIDAQFKAACDYQIEIKEGNPADQIMRWSDIKEIDLIMVGRKLQLRGQGVLPGKLARVAHCSVLFVPENSQPKIDKIVIPVDFSRNSNLALEMALEFKKATSSQLILQNTYTVPWGYHSLGKSYEEFAEIMKEHAHEDAIQFLKRKDIDESSITLELSLDKEESPAERAYEIATKHSADLVIMSSKGRSGIAQLLLGSVAEKMIKLDATIPLMVVKNKNDNMGFFEALMKI
ncbi:universal stress protein [Fulvivirga sp. RKSG066]|uniref:universal stress protein n=1 Tax=Fulvivirga aurantia TaxID=2529383 RepID=UPI0012BD6A8B|nr:universal stress protein [Fulvivirga aurantia]MTI23132.1 universal stress protein [Fulvivirga aurantia]